ncbi:MAG: hypothetical protein KAJ28_03595 [Flavobacteriaceae bacterium]|nr:hypothetical protein [Flavobacteriaceae bacterium]
MIKFFRKIRQNLIMENKTSKYLKYAIGEILLVVIGILIALQINNWNEERKNRILEADYYCQFLEDINQDALEIKKQLDINELRIKNSNKFISLMQQSSFTQFDVIQAMLGAISKTTFTFQPSKAAFEDLKSSGNLGLLKDITIKNKLIAYYTTLEGLIDVIDANSDSSINAFFNYEKDFSEIGWQYLPFVNTEIDTSQVDIKALTPIDYPSKELKKQLLSDAVMFLGTSSRKKDLYLTIANEINIMQNILSNKCNSKND